MHKYFTYRYVNCYVINEDPITIIDPGPVDKDSNEFLRFKLKEYKIKFGDIKRVVLTHGHVDHCGFAGYLEEKYCADIFIHNNDVPKVTLDNKEKIIFKQETFGSLLKQLNFSESVYNSLYSLFQNFYRFGQKVNNVTLLKHEDKLSFENNHLKILHLPGHTGGSSGFIYKTNYFISGDIILDDVFTTPVLEFNQNGESYRNLSNYYISLKKILSIDCENILPGHGKENFNYKLKAKKYIHYIENKANEVLKKFNPKLSIKDNFINMFGEDIDKFFFHFSFYYGLLEFLEIV